MILITGPGHGGPGIVANAYLERKAVKKVGNSRKKVTKALGSR